MGLFDKIKDFFGGKETIQAEPELDSYDKRQMCEEIVEMARRILIKDSFNHTAQSISRYSVYSLQNLSTEELNKMYTNLKSAQIQIENKNKARSNDDSLQRAAWTGERAPGMTSHDVDRYQRGADR